MRKNKITFKWMNCYYYVKFYQSSFRSSRPFDGPPCIAYFLPANASLFFPSPFLFVFHVLIQLCLRAWRGLVQMSDIWLTARKINIQYGDSQSCNRHLHTHDEQGKKFLLILYSLVRRIIAMKLAGGGGGGWKKMRRPVCKPRIKTMTGSH